MPKLTNPHTGETVYATPAGAEVLLARWEPGAVRGESTGRPTDTAPRHEWDAYARAIGLDPDEFRSKKQLVEAINTGQRP